MNAWLATFVNLMLVASMRSASGAVVVVVVAPHPVVVVVVVAPHPVVFLDQVVAVEFATEYGLGFSIVRC
jgi:hypothetical protein